MEHSERLWSHEETARFLHVSIWTLHHLVTKGEGPTSYRVGRGRRYDPVEVRDWLRANAPPVVGAEPSAPELGPAPVQRWEGRPS
jgi:hypothetical protein